MKKTSYLKRSALLSRWVICLLLVSGLFTNSSNAQCTNGSAFGTATLSGTVSGFATIGCNFAGEYGTWNGAVTGNTYNFTSTISTDYITIHTGSPAGPVAAFGTQPLSWVSTVTGTIYVHINTNSGCGTQNSCRDITGTTTAIFVPGCTNVSAFGTQTLSAVVSGFATIGCQFAGEYGTWNGAVTGNTYSFSSTIGTDFLTIHTGTPGGPIVASGTQPLVWTSTVTGTIYVHCNTNSACGTQNSCRDITGTTTALAPITVLTPFTGSSTVPCGQATTVCTHAGCGNVYSNGADGHTVINAANSAVININGTYSTESGFDFITIYAGAGTGGAVLFGPVSGSGTINYTGLAGQTLTVRFTSDGSVTSTGYNLAITYTGSCLPPSLLVPATGSNTNPCGTNVTLCSHAGCGVTYSNGVDGHTVLLSGGTAAININGSYSTESGFDFITIYSGSGTGGPVVFGPVSGSGTINHTGLPGQILTVRFTSDGSVTSTGFNFAVTYSGVCALPCLLGVTASATPSTICVGGTSTLLATPSGNNGAVTYTWNPGGLTGASVNVSPGATTVYTVTATDAVPAGCTATGTVMVSIDNGPVITPSASASTICNGGSSTLGAVQGTTLTWSENLVGGVTTVAQCQSWDAFRASLVPAPYTACKLSGTFDLVGRTATNPTTVQAIASALKNGTNYTQVDGLNTWVVGIGCGGGCGGGVVELSADGTSCSCLSPGYTVRANLVGSNSGGVNTPTCGGPTQTLTVQFSSVGPLNSYSWAPSGSLSCSTCPNPVASPTVTTTYTVTGTNALGCTSTATITVNVINIVASCTGTNVSCNGGSNGTASVSPSGGTAPYSFAWSTGATTSSISGLPIGTYCVTVTDAAGCTGTCCYTVTQPAPLTATAIGTAASCPLCPDGTVSINSVSGGTPGYTFTNLTGLLTGVYCITVTDVNGCTTTACALVGATGCTMVATTTANTNVTCFGGNNGSATVTPTGGVIGPFTYAWSNGATTSSVTGLTAGNYTVIVTDIGSGCIDVGSVTITQPSAVLASCSGTNVTPCFGGSNGSASVSASGGLAPYTYLWSTTSTDASISGLAAGTYCVTVTDASGCTGTCCYVVTEPGALVANCTGTNVTVCATNTNGSAGVTVSGGTAPFSYLWSNAETTASLTGLGTGTYCVTVTDANGCTGTCCYTVTGPPALVVSSTFSNICIPGGTSDIDVTVSGGTPLTNLTYNFNGSLQGWTTGIAGNLCFTGASLPSSWTNQAFGFSGQSFGTTSVGGEHTYIQSPIINLPAALSITAKSWSNNEPGYVYPGCTGYDVEHVEYSTDGGATWIPFFTTNQGNLHGSNLAAWNTLSYTASITPTSNGRIRFRYDNADGCCGGSGTNNGWYIDDVVIAVPPGGYNYLWSNGATTQDLTGVPAGTYTVTVTDGNGCTSTASYTIIEPVTVLSAACSGTDALCNGNANGSASVAGSGGILPYSYNWSNGGTNSSISGLVAGTYCVTITDAIGCIASCCYVVNEPPVLSVSCSGTNALCNGDANGSASVTATGGTTGYTYLWSNASTDASISGLPAGTYCVTVTDANGCSATCCYTVTEPAVLVTTTSQTNVSCFGGSDGTATANPSGGTLPYSYAWSNAATTQTATGLTVGTYTVIVTDGNLCTAMASVIITEPPQLIITETHVDVSCNGGGNGSIDITLAGGTPPFTFLWSNGATTEDLVNISSSTYFVTVTEGNGCTSAFSVTVGQPTAIAAAFVVTNVTCFSAGSIDLTTTGGTPGYSWLWSNGATTEDISGLTTGTYTVTITDANGCSITKSKVVGLTNTLVLTTVVTNASCGLPSGTGTVSVTGGTAPYTYAWSTIPVQTTATATGLPAGVVSVTVTDAFGCVKTKNVTITNSNGLGVKLTSPVYNGGKNISCNGGNDGSATALPLYSPGPYTYIWNTGATTQTITGLTAGTYTVTVSNGGCTATGQITLKQPNPLAITFIKTNVSCNGGSNGTAKANKTGGTNPVTYSWNTVPVQTTQTATGLAAGVYTVTITDANGCTAAAAVTITQPTAALSVTGVTTNLNCFNVNTGTITLTVAGGTSPYTYLWSTGATTKNRTGLAAGTYTVTVTDLKGCVATASFTITQPAQLVVTTTKTNVSCNGGNDGTATANPSGGTPGYSYSWNTVPVQTNATATGLTSGTKTCTVTDANGCSKTVSVTINQPAVISIAITQVNVSTFGGNDGSATANPAGGTPGYSYSWSNGATTQGITGLTAGVYTVTVTDANGCTKTKSATITQPSAKIPGDQNGEMTALNLYPNPNNGQFNLAFESNDNYQYQVTVLDLIGKVVFTNSYKTSIGVNKQSFDFSVMPKGIYIMKVDMDNQHRVIKVIIE